MRNIGSDFRPDDFQKIYLLCLYVSVCVYVCFCKFSFFNNIFFDLRGFFPSCYYLYVIAESRFPKFPAPPPIRHDRSP